MDSNKKKKCQKNIVMTFFVTTSGFLFFYFRRFSKLAATLTGVSLCIYLYRQSIRTRFYAASKWILLGPQMIFLLNWRYQFFPNIIGYYVFSVIVHDFSMMFPPNYICCLIKKRVGLIEKFIDSILSCWSALTVRPQRWLIGQWMAKVEICWRKTHGI